MSERIIKWGFIGCGEGRIVLHQLLRGCSMKYLRIHDMYKSD